MDRNTLLAIALSLLVLSAWSSWEAAHMPPPPPAVAAPGPTPQATEKTTAARAETKQQAAVFQVLDQCREGLIKLRAQQSLVIEIRIIQAAAVGVHVPTTNVEYRVEMIDRHISSPTFDQAASHHAGLAELVLAVRLPEMGRLIVEIEHLRLRRAHQ